jgi:UDP-glucuronate 4-epimerase
MAKRILITGAAGFIGSQLADVLLETGNNVMGIDNYDPFYERSIKETNISHALKNKLYQFREGDIRDAAFINECFSGFKPEVILHLAAKAGVRPSLVNPEAFCDVNVMGTLIVLEAMKKNRIGKLIFASSSSVYGNSKKVPFSEEDNVNNPISPYAASKKAGELLCHAYHHLYSMDIFCLRFFTVYGPRQRPDLAIHKFTKALLKNETISFYGDGTTSRDYTHINDIIFGIIKAVEKVKGFDIFNLGESNTITLARLIGLLERFTGRKAQVNYLPLQKGDVLQTYADIGKAKEVLDYNPVMDIERGLKDYINWYKNFGDK